MTGQQNIEAALLTGWVGRYFEVELAQFYSTILALGGCALDGGSNSGLHAIGMAKAISPGENLVFAFEPQSAVIEEGMRWADNMGVRDRIKFVVAALGHKNGSTTFYVSRTHSALSSLRKMDVQGEYDPTDVSVVNFDSFFESMRSGRLRFVKLDLEGGEYHALLGLHRTLLEDRPVVCFENGVSWAAQQFGYRENAILEFFHDVGYDLFDFFGTRMTVDNFAASKQAFMFFAAPRDSEELQLTCASANLFWANADKLDLSTWPQTVLEVLRTTDRSAERGST